MIVVLILIAVLILFSAKYSGDDFALALSKDQTQTIKGIFVLTVFFSHFCSYVALDQWYDVPMRAYSRWLGQLMVVPFLFYSGYGIFESVNKNGESYVNSFPKKRILKTLIHFDLAVTLFLVYDFFFTPENLSAQKIVLSLFAWDSIGNSNWFIFAILCAYVFSFAALVMCKRNLFRSLIVIIVFCFIYIVVVSRFKDGYWFNTILAFPLGCLISLCKKIFTIRLAVWGVGVIFLPIFIVAKNGLFPNSFVNFQFLVVSFMLLIVFLSMKIKLKSKVLSWFGAQVFGIYILQRLPMNFGKIMHWNEQNIYFYFVFCFVMTIVMAEAFRKLTELIDSKFFKGR